MASTTADALRLRRCARTRLSHGVTRVAQYAAHLMNGRADGKAQPRIVASRGGGIDQRWKRARVSCVCAGGQSGDRTCGRVRVFYWSASPTAIITGVAALSPGARRAAAGMVGLALSNSPAAMPVAGGKRPLLGTNPIAAVFRARSAFPC